MDTCGADLNDLKLAIERPVAIRRHLRTMGVRVYKPATTCCDKKYVVTNTATAWSALGKKNLTLACQLCREQFSEELVDVRWVEGKYNISDAMTLLGCFIAI